ncbi:LodA/GoxA family CTQ-dependent oxidase [Bradyrhizobium sp.]|jgi:hypothetical protein|uniref:LodA/GoxA family CTQ-dependent oxidase n=1 Tax=Bradyrhizobium sp. TaxID=376 RepID=UPI002DF8B373|nr:LodA/GoxA family CTQ-dependent oxidase [Bradyrhizobium sp.]
MATVYKIHPAIGIARVGNHPDAFFIGPETPGAPGVEIGANGAETPVKRYKDGGRIKRQAARFRVFKFDQDNSGNLQLVGEVTADEAKIEWKVDLCNRKGALDHTPAPGHPGAPRNMDVADRNTLIIRNPQPVVISGKDQPGKKFDGKFLDKPVYLGELRTDAKGRLLVLGGRGKSESVPAGAPLDEFMNNDRWHDDASDGPVTAVVTLPEQEPVAVHHASWVTVAPPDFAPAIAAIVTLYDVAFQAAIDKGALSAEPKPSFRRHIKPLVERAASLRWVHNFQEWTSMATVTMKDLADPAGDPQLRSKIAGKLKNPGFSRFIMPAFMDKYLNQWVLGDFISDLIDSDPPAPIPDQLDRAALDACVGNNFYPGIEASLTLRDKDIYARPFRLDHTNLGKVFPGCLSEIMAVPWQADFIECDQQDWWPSQRPDIAMIDADDIPGSQAEWAAPMAIFDHEEMVKHAMQLGFVVAATDNAGKPVFVEQDRDPQYSRAQLMAMASKKKVPTAIKG